VYTVDSVACTPEEQGPHQAMWQVLEVVWRLQKQAPRAFRILYCDRYECTVMADGRIKELVER
jgi:hypothetical protein